MEWMENHHSMRIGCPVECPWDGTGGIDGYKKEAP